MSYLSDYLYEYYKTGKRLPAYVGDSLQWRWRGRLHRKDGPAMVCENGSEYWYYNGQEHRIGGPSSKNSVHESWYVYDKRHRIDGPATIYYETGRFEWWFNGEDFSDRINGWMNDNDITWPFSEEHQILFNLVWLS